MSARRWWDEYVKWGSCCLGRLALLALFLLAASGCVRVRRGWLINLNLSLEWNRVPWRAGPDGHYEIDPPDCVACGHHVPGHRCQKCAVPSWSGTTAAGSKEKLPVLEPPAKLHAVPTQPAWPEDAPAVEDVPDPQAEQDKTPPPQSPPSDQQSAADVQNTPAPVVGETSPQAASWYGRSLARPWVFRTSQAEQSLSHRSVRLQRGERQVR